MLYQTMAEVAAFLRRHQFPQSHLHLFRIFDAVHDTNPVDQTDTMCICHDGRFAEDIPHDQIRTFASDPRKFQQCIKIIRHFSTVLLF